MMRVCAIDVGGTTVKAGILDEHVRGGGVADAGERRLLNPLREGLAARLSYQRMPDLVAAELGDRARCVGTGLMAFDLLGHLR